VMLAKSELPSLAYSNKIKHNYACMIFESPSVRLYVCASHPLSHKQCLTEKLMVNIKRVISGQPTQWKFLILLLPAGIREKSEVPPPVFSVKKHCYRHDKGYATLI
jgi:hypothetical protein